MSSPFIGQLAIIAGALRFNYVPSLLSATSGRVPRTTSSLVYLSIVQAQLPISSFDLVIKQGSQILYILALRGHGDPQSFTTAFGEAEENLKCVLSPKGCLMRYIPALAVARNCA